MPKIIKNGIIENLKLTPETLLAVAGAFLPLVGAVLVFLAIVVTAFVVLADPLIAAAVFVIVIVVVAFLAYGLTTTLINRIIRNKLKQ